MRPASASILAQKSSKLINERGMLRDSSDLMLARPVVERLDEDDFNTEPVNADAAKNDKPAVVEQPVVSYAFPPTGGKVTNKRKPRPMSAAVQKQRNF